MLTAPVNDLCGPIVIADDSEDDVFLLRHRLDQLGVTVPTVVLRDGHETIEYLKQVSLAGRPEAFPALLFLDLKMPRATGFSVLCWLRENEALAQLRVVILSDSQDPGDVALAADLEADAFVAKQTAPEALAELLQRYAPGAFASPAVAGYGA